jgi:hypothetical protein
MKYRAYLGTLSLAAALAALPTAAQKTPADKPAAAVKQAPAAAKPSAAPEAKASAAPAPAKPAAEAKQAAKPRAGGPRDPFVAVIHPVEEPGSKKPPSCGPGVRGILVSQAELNGVVKTPSGPLAVVTTSNNGRTYFLKEGTQLCNGRVASIGGDAVAFEEDFVDSMGKPVKREVIRKIPTEAR